MMIFITGGVRSGKSSFAEMSAVYHGKNEKPLHYIATNEHQDGEMSERIAKHQADRLNSGYSWRAWEQPKNIHELINEYKKKDVILLDCLTNLVSNELFDGWKENNNQWRNEMFRSEVFRKIMDGLRMIEKSSAALIVVSNEVFQDLPSIDEGTFYFMKMMGELHQQIVSEAHWVYQVELGIPILRKGYDAVEKQCTSCPV
ncbi:bifunctional adenosylcobinamide kinase/adenosylcobinamide-phosphate guanylyltransferase [Fictibacillus sp. KU28468]|uniref:bifunctional adenosylcobinamide kinase/adenosylcobinamide-phosphate guanylyltransferase n=1 Tax=Fictibacillus sp. KU28468 TaxID=2991053 RepID=UPI00223C9274|nr:bifunctional adenosylcobinamide kinase/adenosylcobinamide-phosphate guanylyltransferase [Fictibacillus sp. KU28468]UZJ79819.1 bifunctional adenosylcobinamide kinase/adenosylcobinamide-phosphate guanylyltransferase [Fictibacillus sp. KU28468]